MTRLQWLVSLAIAAVLWAGMVDWARPEDEDRRFWVLVLEYADGSLTLGFGFKAGLDCESKLEQILESPGLDAQGGCYYVEDVGDILPPPPGNQRL